MPYEDVSDYISTSEYDENGVLAPGFTEEANTVEGEDDGKNEDDRFIKFGDTSISYYSLLKEISEDLSKIKGLDKFIILVFSSMKVNYTYIFLIN